MIKSIVEIPNEVHDFLFPKLRIRKDGSNTLVLFMDNLTGVILSSAAEQRIGKVVSLLESSEYEDFYGSLTLENV